MLLVFFLPFLQGLIFSIGTALAGPIKDKNEDRVQLVPLVAQPQFWSAEAKLLSYKCVDSVKRLEVRSRISPSTVYAITTGLFNSHDCQSAVDSLRKKGCFCDDRVLKCLETAEMKPLGFVCSGAYMCFKFETEKIGVVETKIIQDAITRNQCEKELNELER